MGERVRIYVGGLGSSVEEVDLKNTFTSPYLGAVQSVQIIRTKARRFAYLEFLPLSDKALAKLFSTYNGCSWKGGRLRLEKAKEDYLARLRREWAEDENVDKVESVKETQKPKKDYDIKKLQLNIFFPKLRKIKPIPLKGSGKHKYSFQRVEVPSLPIHFCDCEEHSRPPDPPKRKYVDNNEMDNYGVNENELNMMKSILSKLVDKETRSETVTTEGEASEEKNNDASLVDKWQVDDSEDDQESDKDNLVINIVGSSSKRIASFEDWGRKTTTVDQNSLVREAGSLSNPTEKGKHILHNKRKQYTPEDKSNDKVSSKKKGNKWNQHDLVVENTQPIDKESGSMRKKSAWKALISEKGSSIFSVSDIVRSLNSEGENKHRSDHLPITPCSDENDGQQDHKEPEKFSDIQSTKTATADQNSMVREPGCCSNPTSEMRGPEKGEHILHQKRMRSISEDKSNDKISAKKKGKKLDDVVVENTQPIDNESGSIHLVGDAKKSNKSAWKALASENVFNVSDIVMSLNSEGENKSDHFAIDINNSQQDQSSQHKEVEKLFDVQSTETTSASVDKSGRGASWLQKSSWLQLVGDVTASAFNLAHILPEATLESPELRSEGQHGDQKSPQGRAEFDIVREGKNDGGEVNSESNPPLVDADMAACNRAVGDIVISETCPFMKSNASMREWMKSKAALKKGKRI